MRASIRHYVKLEKGGVTWLILINAHHRWECGDGRFVIESADRARKIRSFLEHSWIVEIPKNINLSGIFQYVTCARKPAS